jgi:hypothetical protein
VEKLLSLLKKKHRKETQKTLRWGRTCYNGQKNVYFSILRTKKRIHLEGGSVEMILSIRLV